jgi:hypothetical protein
VAKEIGDHTDHRVDPAPAAPPAALNSNSKVVSISRADRAKAASTKVRNLDRADRSPDSRESQANLTTKKKINAATSNLRTPGGSRNETGQQSEK